MWLTPYSLEFQPRCPWAFAERTVLLGGLVRLWTPPCPLEDQKVSLSPWWAEIAGHAWDTRKMGSCLLVYERPASLEDGLGTQRDPHNGELVRDKWHSRERTWPQGRASPWWILLVNGICNFRPIFILQPERWASSFISYKLIQKRVPKY